MKALILLPLCLLYYTSQADNLYASLLEVNDRWAYQSDIPECLYQSPPEINPIQTHLLYVYEVLTARHPAGLTEAQQKNRTALLEILRQYAYAAEFPNNLTHSTRQPVFIGPNGNYCAVGYLISQSGNDALSRKISAHMNYAYLLEMSDEELSSWVAESGLSLQELAWIQPGYPMTAPLESLKGGTNGPVHAVFPLSNGEILAGGSFTEAGTYPITGLAHYYSGFAGYDWKSLSGSGLNGEVYDMIEWNGLMVAGGNFYQADTVGVGAGVAAWDGTKWIAMDEFYVGALVNTVYDLEIYQGELYAAGFFRSKPGAVPMFNHLAKWDGSEWVGMDLSPDAAVMALDVYDDKLILGGYFSNFDTLNIQHLASWDSLNGFQALGTAPALPIRALASVGDTLFAGGEVYSYNFQDTMGLVFYHNQQWQRVENPYPPIQNMRVNALAATPYGLFVGGHIYHAPVMGNYGKNLLRYTAGSLQPYAILDSSVNDLSYSDGLLYIAGDFIQGLSNNGYDTLNHITFSHIGAQFSVEEKNPVSPLMVYPNPARDFVNIRATENLQAEEIRVFEVNGREIFPVLQHDGSTWRMQTKMWKPGLYFIQSGNGQLARLLIE